MTTTTNLNEVRALVDEALAEMGLSGSERNSRFLLQHLKALSGRLAIRLANPSLRTGEMISLALVHAHCAQAEDIAGSWLDLARGFFVPVDEILDVARVGGSEDEPDSSRRADFIHVQTSGRGSLNFASWKLSIGCISGRPVNRNCSMACSGKPENCAAVGTHTSLRKTKALLSGR